jgi:hypothetical protein
MSSLTMRMQRENASERTAGESAMAGESIESQGFPWEAAGGSDAAGGGATGVISI